MSAPRRLVAVINAAAGESGSEAEVARVRAVFATAGVDARIALVDDGAAAAAAARAALRERPDVIVAGGGDGTINAVAGALIGSGIALGVLPLGTLNHFAKALRLPLDVEQAAQAVATGSAINIDVGEVNGRIFLNNSSHGLYPRMVRRRDKQQEQLGRGKWTAAAWATLAVLRRHAFLHVRLYVDGAPIERRTAIVFIGNNAYCMAGLRVGERECLDAGQLCVYMPRRSGRRGLLLLAVRAVLGRLREAEDFDALFAADVRIETRRRHLPVATDGEVSLLDAPLHYRIRPRALRVIAAAPEPAAAAAAAAA
jgi:diacylglycerol kinase family enzyme